MDFLLKGKEIVNRAIRAKEWKRDDPRWLIEASKELDPDLSARYESHLKLDSYALDGQVSYLACISEASWKRFLRGSDIDTKSFKSFCKVLEIPWQTVAESKPLETDYGAGRAAKKLTEAFNLVVHKQDYSRAEEILSDIVPDLIRDAELSKDDGTLDRLRAAQDISHRLTDKLRDPYRLYSLSADIESKLGGSQKALEIYQFVSSNTTGEEQSLADLNAGIMCIAMGQYCDAETALLKLISVQNSEIALQAKHFLGWIAMYQGRYSDAMNILGQNVKEAEELDFSLVKSGANHFLGRTSYEVREFKRAEEFLKRQYSILEQREAPPGKIAHCFRWLARCSWQQQDLLSTERYLLTAQNLFSQSHSLIAEQGLAHIYLHQAEIFVQKDKLHDARTEVEKSKDIWKSKYKKGLADACFMLGHIYKKKSEYQNALIEYECAHEIYTALGSVKSSSTSKVLSRLRRHLR